MAVVVSGEEKALLASEVRHIPQLYCTTLLSRATPLGCTLSLNCTPQPRCSPSKVRAAGREPVKVRVIANAHEPEPRTRTGFARRHGLVFVGNFNHLPNRDAVLHFATEVPCLVRAGSHTLATPLSLSYTP